MIVTQVPRYQKNYYTTLYYLKKNLCCSISYDYAKHVKKIAAKEENELYSSAMHFISNEIETKNI